ncbi:DUF2017 domain-containing protein [Nocardioidaceae bacterium SCSIO 66511]|nr:DUF2017 domain-containing protein [Nocardioidaceae bacterium SCSIO 66511]
MKPFRRRRRGGVYAVFDVHEAEMLANLEAQLIELVSDRSGPSEASPDPLFAQLDVDGPRTAPEDPVLARLFPDAYGDDEESAAEFRRFTERDLASNKIDNATAVLQTLSAGGLLLDGSEQSVKEVEVELDDDAVQAWLRSLTDIRLSVAVRLGLDDDGTEALDRSDEGVALMADIYEWLGFVQESLVQALG